MQRRGSRSGLGAVVGAVVCGVGVRAIHAASSSHEDFSNVPIASLVIGSLGGAMAGALVGRAFRHDRWEPAPLP